MDFRFICQLLALLDLFVVYPFLHSWQFLNFNSSAFVCGNELQGVSSVGVRSSQKSLRAAPSQLCWPLSRPNKKYQNFVYRRTSQNLSFKTFKGPILAEAGKQGWDLGRFLETLYFFNGPPSPAKFFESLIEKLTGPSPSTPVNSMDSSGITLVTGATGGVGRRVVDVLRNKRLHVRVLVCFF